MSKQGKHHEAKQRGYKSTTCPNIRPARTYHNCNSQILHFTIRKQVCCISQRSGHDGLIFVRTQSSITQPLQKLTKLEGWPTGADCNQPGRQPLGVALGALTAADFILPPNQLQPAQSPLPVDAIIHGSTAPPHRAALLDIIWGRAGAGRRCHRVLSRLHNCHY